MKTNIMNIYVAHSNSFDFRNDLYKPIRESHLNKKYHFVFPHEISLEIFDSKNHLKNEANLLIAEVSRISTGLGIELGWADIYKVPILCVYKNGFNISNSLRSVSGNFIEYSDSSELISKIDSFLEKA